MATAPWSASSGCGAEPRAGERRPARRRADLRGARGLTVRPAVASDAAAVAAIYGEGIEEQTATFRTDLPAPAEMAGAIDSPATRLALVAEDDERVGAFSFVVPYAATPAYRGVGEYMIYVALRARRQGMGRELLEATCQQAGEQGHWKLVGKLFADNEPSIALARACGFRDVGVHRRHGQLEGRWRDVLVVERLLGDAAQSPVASRQGPEAAG